VDRLKKKKKDKEEDEQCFLANGEFGYNSIGAVVWGSWRLKREKKK
jgi:hypothetical protein